MPYHVAESAKCPTSKPWAVIKDSDGEIMGCHPSQSAAADQMAALYANENGMMRGVHVRTLPTATELTEGQLLARLIPYNVTARVLDELPGGQYDSYTEGFRLGAARRQAGSSEPGVLRRIGLKHDHDGGLGYLGPLFSLEERDDGLYGEFRVLPSRRGDVAAMYELGIDELSVEFLERKGGTEVDKDGVRWRTDVHLLGAALLPAGAYGRHGAGVLAMRELDELIAEQDAEREHQRIEAEAAAEAAAQAERERVAAEAAEQVAQARRQELADFDTFLAEARQKQADYAERLP